jgi:glycosyltransferase involved in cell wall biosynthesis
MTAIRWVTRRSAKAADHILVQSEAMRATISRAFGLHPERISAFLPTAPTLSGTQAKSPKLDILRAASGRRVILYVGNESPHRNLEVLERGLQQFPEAERPNWFATLPGNSPFCRGGSAIGLGTLKRDELYEAYRSATVLVMPSLAETVGLPMLEAMRLGTPVLAADRPYAHEVCEDAAEFFDPLSPFDFARKARGLFTDTGRRASLVERGRRLVERRDKLNPYRSMLQKAMEVAEKVARQRGKTESE